MKMNRLGQETSPYLQQHAGNPVDWRPWGDDALELAKSSGKPILLSIGYSACHWCHVMAHESFENESIARLMNEFFICIKVDREERPDIDKIYQTAHHFLTQKTGGWPLTMFLGPDQTPFFGGTYFPPEPRHGLPGFADLLQRVRDYYNQHGNEIQQQNLALLEALQKSQALNPSQIEQINAEPLSRVMAQLGQQFDSTHGGFGAAPKFPQPSNLDICIRNFIRTGNERALLMAQFSLRQMVDKGLYDQLGGGFFRYSVDRKWEIPHFEKMLYDNAQMLSLCADTAKLGNRPLFSRIMQETGDWVIREMQSQDGGYFSTLDADSEGEEGRFYTWSLTQMEQLLTEEEAGLVALRYGLVGEGNFEGDWHLNIAATISEVSEQSGLSEKRVIVALSGATQKLWQARELRIKPSRDEKVLTAWNGLMIRGMAAAGRFLDHQPFIDSATEALVFIQKNLWRDGRLLASYKDGKAQGNGYLEDHVFLIEGILELLQAQWRAEFFEFALQLADILLDHFEDPIEGGFFMTSDDHEKLILRTKSMNDDALPAANAVAAKVLLKLGHLTGNTEYLRSAESVLKGAWQFLAEMPLGFGSMMGVLDEYLFPPRVVIVRGAMAATKEWLPAACDRLHPGEMVFVIPKTSEPLPGLLAHKVAADKPLAYVCRGTSCSEPITAASELRSQLHSPSISI